MKYFLFWLLVVAVVVGLCALTYFIVKSMFTTKKSRHTRRKK